MVAIVEITTVSIVEITTIGIVEITTAATMGRTGKTRTMKFTDLIVSPIVKIRRKLINVWRGETSIMSGEKRSPS
jgi:hypothetical protein